MQDIAVASSLVQELSIIAASDKAAVDAKISQVLIDSGVTATMNAGKMISTSVGYAANSTNYAISSSADRITDAVNAIVVKTGGSGGGGLGGLVSGVIGGVSDIVHSIGSIFGFASGGIASTGIHLVGEHGPELVDFKTSGRVYNATDTTTLFNVPGQTGNSNRAMLLELKALRNEISQLRQDQQEQTGHLINSQYDSQNQNAQAVSSAVTNTVATQALIAKTQANVKLN
jgi:hypothetical protein